MALKVVYFDQTSVIKSIEIPSNNTHPDKKTISLGLSKINRSESYLSNIVNSSLQGRTTTISVGDAEHIAQLIADQIHAPVTIVRGFKTGNPSITMESHEQTVRLNKEEDVHAPLALEFTNIEHFRTVVQFLEKQQYISSNDCKRLDPFIKEIEDSNLSSIGTTAQKDALRAAVGTCIDAIIELCANANSRDEFLSTDNNWLDIRGPFNKGAIARAILFQSCQTLPGAVFYEQFMGLKKGYDAAYKISDIYERGLESTRFENIGKSVPQLEVQRAILAELIEEKLNAKFGAENLEGIPEGSNPALVKALRQRLFSDGYSLDMIAIISSGSPDVLHQLQIIPFEATIDAMEGKFGQEVGDTF